MLRLRILEHESTNSTWQGQQLQFPFLMRDAGSGERAVGSMSQEPNNCRYIKAVQRFKHGQRFKCRSPGCQQSQESGAALLDGPARMHKR